MKYLSAFSLFLALSFLSSCNSPAPDKTSREKQKPRFIQRLEVGHFANNYEKMEELSFLIKIVFGDNVRFEGKMVLSTKEWKGKLTAFSGEEIIFIGDQVFISPNVEMDDPRFEAFTWPYFALLPYKLSDPGTQYSELKEVTLKDRQFEMFRLSFDPETGDDPNDWYDIYFNHFQKNLINHAVYIVTAKSEDMRVAEASPHMIEYTNYQYTNEDIMFAMGWNFFDWDNNWAGKQLGSAELGNVEFRKTATEDFSIPSGYIEVVDNLKNNTQTR